jgi:hypothetical protein
MRGQARVVGLLMAVMGGLLWATPASAIVGGQPTGPAYGNVGLLIKDGYAFCSATLISPTVVLSAAHCFAGGEPGPVDVTFQPAVAFDSEGRVTGAPTVSGDPHYDPRFVLNPSPGTKAFIASNEHDLSVIVLDRPASDVFPGIQPAQLPPLGVLDALARDFRAKDSAAFTAVGYGLTRDAHANPNRTTGFGERRFATEPLDHLDALLVWMKGNPNPSWGNGGICFGDSGGPDFLGAGSMVVGVHSFVQTPCHNLSASVRLDTASARSFLSPFVALP